jgi:hypothetical protein
MNSDTDEITDDEIVEIVDEIADELNPHFIYAEAKRLGLSMEDLLERVTVEVRARVY